MLLWNETDACVEGFHYCVSVDYNKSHATSLSVMCMRAGFKRLRTLSNEFSIKQLRSCSIARVSAMSLLQGELQNRTIRKNN